MQRTPTSVLDTKKTVVKRTVVKLPLSISLPTSESTTTFLRYPTYYFTRTIPFYIDDGNVLTKLHTWIYGSKETEIAFIEDNPGLGKSTTPYAAAIHCGVGYAVLENGAGPMAALNALIESELNKFPKGAKEATIVNKITSIFYHFFTHLFETCAEQVSSHKSTNFRGKVFNYDISTFCDVASLRPRLLDSLRKLTSIVETINLSGHFIFHFDEMQQWVVEDFVRDSNRIVDPSNFTKYYLIAFCDSLQALKGTQFRCIISGTNIECRKVLQRQSQMKSIKLELPLFSEAATFQLLELFCHVDHLDKEEFMKQIVSPLSGCVRSVEYFLKAVSEQLNYADTKSVTIQALYKCLMTSYYDWEVDIGGRCSNLFPVEFVHEFLLVCMFPYYVGGEVDVVYPDQAFCFPQKNLPNSWLLYAEAGAVRIQTLGSELYRLWIPYHFLLMWIKTKTAYFDFDDVDALRCEINAGLSAPIIHKGYCFQRAVALELVNMQISNLWKLIVSQLAELKLFVTPIPLVSNKITFFSKDEQIKQDTICNAQNGNVKGMKRTAKKKGDICGPRLQDSDGQDWDLIIEAKNYTTNHNDKLCKFYDRSYAKNSSKNREIFVYLSLNESLETFSHYSRKKTNKVFLFINGLRNGDNFQFLSKPKQMTLHELNNNLSLNLPLNRSKSLFHNPSTPKTILLYRYNSRITACTLTVPNTLGELIKTAQTLFSDENISEIWNYDPFTLQIVVNISNVSQMNNNQYYYCATTAERVQLENHIEINKDD